VDTRASKNKARTSATRLGLIGRSLIDQQLEEKFRDQAVRVILNGQVDQATDLCRRIGKLSDVRELVRACVPRA
jgi:hypothetical protein